MRIPGTLGASAAALAMCLATNLAHAQRVEPFVGGAAFATVNATNASNLVEEDGVTLAVRETEVETGYSVAASAGLRLTTARTNNTAAYTIGLAVSGDAEVQPENIIQGLTLTNETNINRRWQFRASNEFFWGTVLSEQDFDFVSGAPDLDDSGSGPVATSPENRDARDVVANPGAQPVQAPRSSTNDPIPTPGGDGGDADDLDTVDNRSAVVINSIRYIRNGASVGLAYAPTFRWRHDWSTFFNVQYFIDRDLIRDFQIRLFDNYSAGTAYAIGYQPNPFNELSLELNGSATWFDAADASLLEDDSTDLQGASLSESSRTWQVGADAGWRHNFNPRWELSLGGGGALLFPEEATDQVQATATGNAGVAHRRNRWTYQAQVTRGVQRSELGAIFATTALSTLIQGQLAFRTTMEFSGTVSRQDVLVLVQREGEDLSDENLQGWTIGGAAQLAYGFSDEVAASVVYSADQRFPDSIEGQADLPGPVSHRVSIGIRVGDGGGSAGGVGGR